MKNIVFADNDTRNTQINRWLYIDARFQITSPSVMICNRVYHVANMY